MRRTAFFLIAALLLAVSPACATSVFYEITPSDSKQGGFAFEITNKIQPDGTTVFHIVITSSTRPFPDKFSADLSSVSITERSSSVEGQRQLPFQRKDNSLTGDFSVTRASLDAPDLCFVLTTLPAPNMPSVTFHYVHLKKFVELLP